MSKFAQNCGFWPLEADTITDSDEIWPVGVDLGSALAHQIWPVQEPPKMSKFAQNCGFWPPEADTVNTFKCNFGL